MDVDEVIVVDDLAMLGTLGELEGQIPMLDRHSGAQQQRHDPAAGGLDGGHRADGAAEPVGVVPRLDAAAHGHVVTMDLDIPTIGA